MGSEVNNPDGVETYPASNADLETFKRAEEGLKQLEVPIFLNSKNPHERLYIAAQDGTGNNMFADKPENWSTVARVHKEIRDTNNPDIKSGYVQGIGTQKDWLPRTVDGITGDTFEHRVETAYFQFCEQAKKWIDQDPKAEIRVATLGFSRGAEQSVALNQMIHERGIRNPKDAQITKDAEGLITHIEYAKHPPLVPPGKTLQAVMAIDPVGTGLDENPRKLPPSVVSCLQLTALNERRDQFPSTQHIPPGLSEGNKCANFSVAGAHSNLGNTYTLNGIGVRSQHLVVDYMNALSDKPFITKQPLPTDPAMNVIHRSEQHQWFYTTKHTDEHGQQRHVLPNARVPIDPALEQRLTLHKADIGDAPKNIPKAQEQPVQTEKLIEPIKTIENPSPNNAGKDQQSQPFKAGSLDFNSDSFARLDHIFKAFTSDNPELNFKLAAQDLGNTQFGLDYKAEIKEVTQAHEQQQLAQLQAQHQAMESAPRMSGPSLSL
jgi:hypothetical protein